MNEAIAESRRDEATRPRQHYLCRLHPVVAWLDDRMLAAFGRHEAPVLAGIPGLAPDETVFVVSGPVSSRMGVDRGHHDHGRDTVAESDLRDGRRWLTNSRSTLWIYTVFGTFIALKPASGVNPCLDQHRR